MPVQNIRAAHNLLALIAHKALLNGDDRQTVHDANAMLFEFINKHDPQKETVTPAPDPAAARQVDTAIAGAKEAITAKPTPAPKPKAFTPPKLDHSQLPKAGKGAAAATPPSAVSRKTKS